MDISSVIKEAGLTRVARACQVTPAAVHRWQRRNRLPRTEYTGETRYAPVIAALHGGVTVEQLLKFDNGEVLPPGP